MKPRRIELETGLDVGTVNAYFFPTPEPVLVDTGIKSAQGYQTIVNTLAEYELTIADLSRVVITHPHVDHCGLAGRIVAESDATVWIYEAGQPWLVDFPRLWAERTGFYRDHFLRKLGLPALAEQLIVGYMTHIVQQTDSVPGERLVSFGLDASLTMGGLAWQVLHTPGHASMMTCFYQPETRQFLSADMLLPKTPTPVVEQPLPGQSRTPSLPVYLDSLAMVEQLDIEWVYPGHGDPFTNHRQLIAHQRGRIHQRKQQCLELIGMGTNTVAAIVDTMYADYPPQMRFTALWMVVGYLDLLKQEGGVVEQEIEGVWRYFGAGD
jgi:glyoxylase-like metal-dependent hydrolase (beta-lactamase superfamily II)